MGPSAEASAAPDVRTPQQTVVDDSGRATTGPTSERSNCDRSPTAGAVATVSVEPVWSAIGGARNGSEPGADTTFSVTLPAAEADR